MAMPKACNANPTPIAFAVQALGVGLALIVAERLLLGTHPATLPVATAVSSGLSILPLVVTELIEEGKAKIQVLRSTDKWYGVTYREDKPLVVEAIARKTAEGQYPENLWA